MKITIMLSSILFSSFVSAVTKDITSLSDEQTLTLEQCIDIAINQNASVDEAAAKIDEFRARLLEVQSNYYPKFSMMAYIAPMFTVMGDATAPVKYDFSPGAWGPYTHLEAMLSMPIYTFGRLEAGERAAKERLNVEKAKLRESQNHVKLEVIKFYYTYLYASTMLTHLKQAEAMGEEIYEKAQSFYDEANGKVTKVDLMKLKYADAEIKKHILTAEEGMLLSLSALKHTMGLDDETALVLSHQSMPKPAKKLVLADERELIEHAIENRPEWAQIRHGLKAIASLRESQKKATKPIIFVAGTIESNWAPTRQDTTNPYQYDPYNNVFGGVAVGLKLDLDWKLNKAKLASINAKHREVSALKKKAITGIPLQIKKSRSEVIRLHQEIKLSKDARKAANKWIIFSGAAYASGAGEVKDVLEGVVASLSAKRDYYESILKFYIATAELNYAIGK